MPRSEVSSRYYSRAARSRPQCAGQVLSRWPSGSSPSWCNSPRPRRANVSKHLGILSDAGMVSRRKEGLKTFYEISDPQKIFKLCDLMCSKLQKEFTEKSRHFR